MYSSLEAPGVIQQHYTQNQDILLILCQSLFINLMKLTNIINILRRSLKNINTNMASLIKILKNTPKEETFTDIMQGKCLQLVLNVYSYYCFVNVRLEVSHWQ